MFLRVVKRGYQNQRFYYHRLSKEDMIYVWDSDDLTIEKVYLNDIRSHMIPVSNLDVPYALRDQMYLSLESPVNCFSYKSDPNVGIVIRLNGKSYKFTGDVDYNGVYSLKMNRRRVFAQKIGEMPDNLFSGFLYFFKLVDYIIGRWSVEYDLDDGTFEQIVVSFIWSTNGVLIGIVPEENSFGKIKLNCTPLEALVAKFRLLNLEY